MRLSLAEELRRDAIHESLKAEANLQRTFIRSLATICRTSGNDLLSRLLDFNPEACSAAETLEYWQRDAPKQTAHVEIRNFLRSIVRNDCQPVFAVASLSTASADPTVFLPVPYGAEPFEFEDFKNSLWVNAPSERFRQDTIDSAEAAARVISHALANVSYSVRLDDEPTFGWLAWAQQSSEPIYVPRVELLATSLELMEPPSPGVQSVSRREEVFLGMASVLYLPIPDYYNKNSARASAVVMLWSPVPGRWDGCFEQHSVTKRTPEHYGTNDAFQLPQLKDDEIRALLWDRFSWLGAVADRDRSDKRKAELELLSFILAMRSWTSKQTTVTAQHFDRFFHGSISLLEQLAAGETPQRPVQAWLDDLVRHSSSFVRGLQTRRQEISLDDVPFRLTVYPGQPIGGLKSSFRLGDRDSSDTCFEYLSAIPQNLCVRFSRETSNHIAGEPAENIARYAERLDAIESEVTKRFITLRYFEIPRDAHISYFTGSRAAFERYYAARRGLVVPREDGSGLGLWLYHLYEARMRLFRRLYVSADGAEWYTQITAPVDTIMS